MYWFDVSFDSVRAWFVMTESGDAVAAINPEYRTKLDELGLVSYSSRRPKHGEGGGRTARFVFLTQDGAAIARLMVNG